MTPYVFWPAYFVVLVLGAVADIIVPLGGLGAIALGTTLGFMYGRSSHD